MISIIQTNCTFYVIHELCNTYFSAMQLINC